MNDNSISVSMIVKNESSCIAKALESVRGADEIVICDTGSADNTIEIARRFTDKVFTDYTWNDNFAEARNHSLSKCTKEWVLIIDADEHLENNGIEKIREFLKGHINGHNAVYFNTVADSTSPERHKSIRLFKRNAGIIWKGAAHNYLTENKGILSDITLYYGYSDAHKQDPYRTIRILEKTIEQNPALSRETFYLAREYWYKKNYATAIKYFSHYLTIAVWGPEIAEAQLTIAKCHIAIGNWIEGRKWCMEAMATNANLREAFALMATLSGPKNAKQWNKIAASATNEDVLFIRQ